MGSTNALKRLLIDYSLKIKSLFNHRDPHVWVFGEWLGKRCGDNSALFANYIAKNYKGITIYWIACEGIDTSILSDRVRVLAMDSPAAKNILLSAGVAFMTHDMRDFTSDGYFYLAGAVIVQLWHGVAWKYIGLDAIVKKNILYKMYYRLLYRLIPSDLYIAPSEDYASYMKTAFLAKEDQIIRTGSPRNMVFYHKDDIRMIRKKTIDKLYNTLNCCVKNETKVILYLPTFRDKHNSESPFSALLNNHSFREWMINNDIIILHKAHFVDQNRSLGEINGVHMYNCNQFSAVELMCVADVLITDYSSCFFDYLLLDRPIIHYIYDYEYYFNEDRGLYYCWEDVACGDVAFNIDELQEKIIKNINDPDSSMDLRKKRRKQYITYENPNSCDQIFNAVMKRVNNKK